MQQPVSGVVAPMSMDNQQNMQQQQYQQHPPQQQWMLMPPTHQPQTNPNQPPVPWATPSPQQSQPQQYASSPATSSDEIRSLWIGDLQYWMDETYMNNCFYHTGELVSAKVIRNKQTGQAEGYGFIEFRSQAAAEKVLQSYNGTPMPNVEQNFRLNWATLSSGDRRADETPDYTIFVGDLAADVSDYILLETFKAVYPSVKGAKVVTDRNTGCSKGYGFVRFGDESEQMRAMTEMNGSLCSTRPMRIGPAATKKLVGGQQYQNASYQSPQGSQGESDPNNTTIFVGGLDPNVSDEALKQVFGHFGELVHVKIPVGKRCGFVQFAHRGCAEQALSILNGTQIGGQSVRLSWGRSPASKQAQPDLTQWNGAGGYYGYAQGYEAYGYAPPAQDPNVYYGGYLGYGNYQQPQQ